MATNINITKSPTAQLAEELPELLLRYSNMKAKQDSAQEYLDMAKQKFSYEQEQLVKAQDAKKILSESTAFNLPEEGDVNWGTVNTGDWQKDFKTYQKGMAEKNMTADITTFLPQWHAKKALQATANINKFNAELAMNTNLYGESKAKKMMREKGGDDFYYNLVSTFGEKSVHDMGILYEPKKIGFLERFFGDNIATRNPKTSGAVGTLTLGGAAIGSKYLINRASDFIKATDDLEGLKATDKKSLNEIKESLKSFDKKTSQYKGVSPKALEELNKDRKVLTDKIKSMSDKLKKNYPGWGRKLASGALRQAPGMATFVAPGIGKAIDESLGLDAPVAQTVGTGALGIKGAKDVIKFLKFATAKLPKKLAPKLTAAAATALADSPYLGPMDAIAVLMTVGFTWQAATDLYNEYVGTPQ
tara:strand:+ start:713 stop:1963 length:1251 start_codon:yes stop_codon:yes gene_type:complete